MGSRLTDFERAAPFAGDHRAALAEVQHRLAQLQLAQIVHRRRALILFEGWEGAGKKSALRRLVAALDPTAIAVHSVESGQFPDQERHWLAPFWSRLPDSGETNIFFRSWYRTVVEARAAGVLDDKGWARAFDEINEFEAQQADHGTLVVKLFFHVAADVQERRLQTRGEDPWLRWTLTPEDLRSHSARDSYLAAWEQMFALSDTRWAPWRIVDSGDEQSADIAALTAVAEALAKAIPVEPPARDDKVVLLAREKFA